MKFIRISLLGLLILMLTACGPTKIEANGSKAIDLQGHRGARGLFPENTLPAFEAAIKHGMTTLELDLHLCRDEKFVIIHDHRITSENLSTPDNAPLKSLWIHKMSLAETQQLKLGDKPHQKFPQQQLISPRPPLPFRSFLQHFSVPQYQQLRFNVELKFPPNWEDEIELSKVAKLLIQSIQDYELLNQVTVQCFYTPFLKEVKKLNPQVQTSALYAPTKQQGLLMKLGLDANRSKILTDAISIEANVISPHHLYCSKKFVTDCHEANLKVIPWTVNNPKEMKHLLNNGVDGLISDYPDLLQSNYQTWLQTK